MYLKTNEDKTSRPELSRTVSVSASSILLGLTMAWTYKCPTTYGRLMSSHISRAIKSAFWRPTLPSTSRNVLTRLRIKKNNTVNTAPSTGKLEDALCPSGWRCSLCPGVEVRLHHLYKISRRSVSVPRHVHQGESSAHPEEVHLLRVTLREKNKRKNTAGLRFGSNELIRYIEVVKQELP